jgi:hypothetical protein
VPAVVASLPVSAATPGAGVLLQRILGSGVVPYEGMADTVGRFPLPDLPNLDEPIGLLGDRNRLRVWFRASDHYRVDELSLFGETGTYVAPSGTWRWDSERRVASPSTAPAGERLPRPFDLTPPELGRRLASIAQPGDVLTDLPAQRVGGHDVPGVRIRPAATAATTVEHVDLWADAATGVVLRAEVTATGGRRPAVASEFREVTVGRADAAAVDWHPAPDVRVRSTTTFDPVALAGRLSGAALPASIAGVARSDGTGSGAPAGAVGLYGEGYGTVAVLAVDSRFLPRGLDSALPLSDRPWGGQARVLELGLVTVLTVDARGTAYVLAGAVPTSVLDAFAADLAGRGAAG